VVCIHGWSATPDAGIRSKIKEHVWCVVHGRDGFCLAYDEGIEGDKEMRSPARLRCLASPYLHVIPRRICPFPYWRLSRPLLGSL
jgi:hypothetical protein